MKRIAIFCDGTWNRSDAPHPTNVVKLSLATRRSAEDGTTQHLIYLPGVGTGRGTGQLARAMDRILGGAVGWGVTETIEEAYRHLAFTFEPGDRLYIFGFSRGAFTARSLAGLIRSAGIPNRENVGHIPEAIGRYRDRAANTHPNHPYSFAFRRDFAPWVTTSQAEADWRQAQGLAPAMALTIAYLGVWDTVGALGIPDFLPLASWFNRGNAFHDHALSRMVSSARHAVAIDERRRSFPPTLWDNLEELNGTDDERPYRQSWFPGVHSAVGGGGDIEGLVAYPLLWIAEGAARAEVGPSGGRTGLDFDRTILERIAETRDPCAPLEAKSRSKAGWFDRLTRLSLADRAGPLDIADISEPARLRWHRYRPPGYSDGPYRPAPLNEVRYHLSRSTETPSVPEPTVSGTRPAPAHPGS